MIKLAVNILLEIYLFREKLKKIHENQTNELLKYIQAVSSKFKWTQNEIKFYGFFFQSAELYKNEEIEYQLAAKQECIV